MLITESITMVMEIDEFFKDLEEQTFSNDVDSSSNGSPVLAFGCHLSGAGSPSPNHLDSYEELKSGAGSPFSYMSKQSFGNSNFGEKPFGQLIIPTVDNRYGRANSLDSAMQDSSPLHELNSPLSMKLLSSFEVSPHISHINSPVPSLSPSDSMALPPLGSSFSYEYLPRQYGWMDSPVYGNNNAGWSSPTNSPIEILQSESFGNFTLQSSPSFQQQHAPLLYANNYHAPLNTFTSTKVYKTSLKGSKTKVQVFECKFPNCSTSEKYHNESDLVNHLKVANHRGESVRKFHCDLCGFPFERKSDLTRHQKGKHLKVKQKKSKKNAVQNMTDEKKIN